MLGALQFQVSEIPQDFFVDILSGNNFLYSTLKVFKQFFDVESTLLIYLHQGFFELLSDSSLDSQLLQRAQNFRSFVEKRFGLTFSNSITDNMDDEDAPTVVVFDDGNN